MPWSPALQGSRQLSSKCFVLQLWVIELLHDHRNSSLRRNHGWRILSNCRMASLVICVLLQPLSCCWMELRGCVTPAILERLAIVTVNNITGFQDLKFVDFPMLWSFLETKSCFSQAFRPAKDSPSDIATSYWSRRYSRNSQRQSAQPYSCNAKYWLWTDKFKEKGTSRS